MESILAAARAMSWAEIVGTVFGLWSVMLTVRARVACWPTGIVSVVAYGILFLQIRLYADALLQVFFTATSFWGWWLWVRGGENHGELPVSRLLPRERWRIGLVTVVAIAVAAWMFRSYTDAHLPFWDSTIAGGSVAAQLLLMKKKIESWWLWIAVDVLSVGVYVYKAVYLTAILYAVFLFLAVKGLRAWNAGFATA